MRSTVCVRAVAIAACGTVALIVSTALARAVYYAGPPPGHTGGFTDDTCHQCHFENDLNDPAGLLELTGLPDSIEPNRSYEIVVTLEHAEMERAGFQLSSRVADGERAGQQAGVLEPTDGRVQVRPGDGDDPILYASHSPDGTPLTGDGEAAWTVRWTAPAEPMTVVFHVAANAANGDDSEFGDHIYVSEGLIGQRP